MAGWADDAQGFSLADTRTGTAVRPAFGDLNLSLANDGSESAVRVPLWTGKGIQLGRILPYLSLGAQGLVVDGREDLAGWSLNQDSTRGTAPGLDVGAGLSWQIFDRLELFGEYRFLHVRPDAQAGSAGGVLRRDVEGPYLKGGFSIRLF